MATLPSDIIFDILLKLPAKSLCRFRCVSKSWFALITNPSFVKCHLSQSQTKKLILCPHDYNGYFIDHEAIYNQNSVAAKISFPLKNCERIYFPLSDPIRIYGSCNGLVCFGNYQRYGIHPCDSFLVMNPSTKEFKKIPKLPDEHLYTCYSDRLYGFGYAEPIGDYKIVKFCGCQKIVNVFSMKRNSWKKIKHDFHWRYASDIPGASVNGAIHWVFDNNKIAAFDLVEEKFKTLPLPDVIIDVSMCLLRVLEGSLLLYHELGSQEFWIMKEYGVQKSWSRILTGFPFCYLRPLCYLKNNEIMLGLNFKTFVFYNIKDGRLKPFTMEGFSSSATFSIEVHVDSLVSPISFL